MASRKKADVELFNLMNVGPYLQRYGGKIDLSLNESHHQVPERVKAAIAASLNHLHEYPLSREAVVIELFHGNGGLDAFLARTEILVCLLPHTAQTEGILNRALFRKLKRDGALNEAVLINAGRGNLQIEDDIIAAVDEGALTAATLDVFAREPLPSTSPQWIIRITPHNAAFSDSRSIAVYMLKQIERLERGFPLEHVVDRDAGY